MNANIRTAEVVLRCSAWDETLEFLLETLGFRLDSIFPADSPSVAVVSGHGVRLRLHRDAAAAPCVLRLSCDDPDALTGGGRTLRGPGELRVELVEADRPLIVPPNRPSFSSSRLRGEATWKAGRAGMRYRDLIPDRQGGRFIASHISIPEGGTVPDYVHFHEIRFQMIYCYKGWVRVVYEDQGASFVLEAGDCVLQPPRIRHRVLECSDGLEVIEVGCPADHATHADHELTLPTQQVREGRDFDGQRFLRHQARAATWQPWRVRGFEARDTGIAAATGGLAGARVVRPLGREGDPRGEACGAEAELLLTFVLRGAVSLCRKGGGIEALQAGDCFAMPGGQPYGLTGFSGDLEFLEVSSPGL